MQFNISCCCCSLFTDPTTDHGDELQMLRDMVATQKAEITKLTVQLEAKDVQLQQLRYKLHLHTTLVLKPESVHESDVLGYFQ